MSDTAQTFSLVAAEVGPLLDMLKQNPDVAHDTLFSLQALADKLPQGSQMRQVIEGQMIHLLTRNFPVKEEKINDTLGLMAKLGVQFSDNQSLQSSIDAQSARMLTLKLTAVNQTLDDKQAGVSADGAVKVESAFDASPKAEPVQDQATEPEKDPEPEPEPIELEPEPEPVKIEAAPEPEVAESAVPAEEPMPEPEKAPEPAPQPEPAEAKPDNQQQQRDAIADAATKLQVALDQLPVSTRNAMAEFRPIVTKNGDTKAFAASLEEEMNKSKPANPAFNGLNGDDKLEARLERVKVELEKLTTLAEALDKVPAEADQLQALYDQVDEKHKNEKGVFGYFHDKYGGNARRFVVERTAQYAKYVPTAEAHTRMMEDLKKLMDQCQKELKNAPKSTAANGKANGANPSHGRSFFGG